MFIHYDDEPPAAGPHDARIARYIARRLGTHRARRAAWRQAGGDVETWRQIMASTLAEASRWTSLYAVVAAGIVLWDVWPAIPW